MSKESKKFIADRMVPVTGKDGKPKDGIYKMSNTDLHDFYEMQGIEKPKQVLKAIGDAETELIVAAAEVLGDNVIKTKEDQELRIGSGRQGALTVRQFGKTENKNIKTGETVVKFGTTRVVKKCKLGTSIFKEGGALHENQQRIAKAFAVK